MAARKTTARKPSKKARNTRRPAAGRRAPEAEVTFLEELETVGAAVETAAGNEADEFFFLYVPRR